MTSSIDMFSSLFMPKRGGVSELFYESRVSIIVSFKKNV